MPEPTTDHAAALADAVRLVLEGKATAGDRERVLLGDLRQSRIKLKRANETIDALTARVPADGALVIPKEDAAGLDLAAVKAFKALNLSPADLAARLSKGDEAAARIAEGDRVKAIVDAVEPAGFNGRLLAKLAAQEGFVVSTKTETVDGKSVVTPLAQKLGADGKPTGDAQPLDAFATAHLAEYGDALRAKPASSTGTSSSASNGTNGGGRAAGAAFHQQSGTGRAPAGDVVATAVTQFNTERASRPSAFAKPATGGTGKAA